MNGSQHAIKDADGRVVGYRIRYRIGGRATSQTFKGVGAKRRADRRLAEIRLLTADPHAYRKERNSRITLAEYLEGSEEMTTWPSAMKRLEPPTAARHEGFLRNHILPNLGSRRPDTIRRSELQAILTELLDTHAESSVQNVRSTITKVWKAMLVDEVVTTNTAAGLEVRKTSAQQSEAELTKPKRQPIPLTHLERIVAEMREGIQAAAWVMVFAGLRAGEVCALRHVDWDSEKRALTVAGTMTKRSVRKAPKNRSSEATIIVPRRLADIIDKHIADDHATDEYLFESVTGSRMNPDILRKQEWDPAVRKAGVPDMYTPHWCRHTTASLLISVGKPITVVSAYLRHANPAITLTHYAHLLPQDTGAAADALDSMDG